MLITLFHKISIRGYYVNIVFVYKRRVRVNYHLTMLRLNSRDRSEIAHIFGIYTLKNDLTVDFIPKNHPVPLNIAVVIVRLSKTKC